MTDQKDRYLNAPFGAVFAEKMIVSRFDEDGFGKPELMPTGPISIHPGAHVLHYSSSIFEGLKAHRRVDGDIGIFRIDSHIARMQNSASLLLLPEPPAELLEDMMTTLVDAVRDEIPDSPGSLYLRPLLFGTDPNVGAAASPSKSGMLFILGCPVGDYFAGGVRPLKILVETEQPRSTPTFGMAKSGANYAAALRMIVDAKVNLKADQVLFAPGGDVQETGAANFLLIDDHRVMTKPVDPSFLPGITRSSILQIAADLGYEVMERHFTVDEMLEWIREGEAALSGTAAVLAGIGTLLYQGSEHTVGGGEVGPNTLRLRQALTDTQVGNTPDTHGWVRKV